MPKHRRIPESQWQWYGGPLHLCVAFDCHFHLATLVGDYVVSTVGDYRKTRDGLPETIGMDREYETMVFPRRGDCDCGCRQPGANTAVVLDFKGYRTIADANAGHRELCEAWAKKGPY